MTQIHNSKNLGSHSCWHKAVSLAVLITFSSSIISPAFAEIQPAPPEPALENTNPPQIVEDKTTADAVIVPINGKTAPLAEEEQPLAVVVMYVPETDDSNIGAINGFQNLPLKNDNTLGAEDTTTIKTAMVPTEAATPLAAENKGTGVDSVNNPQGVLTNLKEMGSNGINSLFCVIAPLSAESKKYFTEFFATIFEPDTAKFLTDYLDKFRPLALKEITKKTLCRGARALAFIGQFREAFSLTEAGMFLKRTPVEDIRNFGPLVSKATAAGDYLGAGKITRNSLIAHIFVLPIQIGIGFATGPAFKALGQPEAVCQAVDVYSKWSAVSSTLGELGGMTGDSLLALERPEYQWIPSVLNAFLAKLFYLTHNRMAGPGADPTAALKRLAISEAGAYAITTTLIFANLYLDPKYDKYQLFNVTYDEIADPETLKNIWEYGTASMHLTTTLSSLANSLTVGLIGADALVAKGTLDMIALLVSPIVVAGAHSAKKIVSESTARNETSAEVRQNIVSGLMASVPMVIIYLIPAIFPGKFIADPSKASLVRISAITNMIQGVERSATEMSSAFKQGEQSWLKTIGSWTKLGVPVVGFMLFKFNCIERNVPNYAIIQIITTIPSLLNIGAIWNYQGKDQK